MTKELKKIVLFDGVCNFCNSSVNFIIENDKKDVFRFSSLQSVFGQKYLSKFNLPAYYFSTLILIEDERFYVRSSAALRIAKHLSLPYNLLYIFIFVPPFIRNIFYDLISRNRYKWFGKKDQCRIPNAEERAKFIE